MTVVCGKGNNGGDGLVVARLLRVTGRPVTVVCVSDPQELRGDARTNLERLTGEPPLRLDGSPWGDGEASRADPLAAGVIVDALLGTGFAGAPRGAVQEAIEQIERSDVPVISVDVPSGVDASSGVIEGAAVRALATVTFPRGQAGPVDPARQGARRRRDGHRHRHPTWRSDERVDRADRALASCAGSCPGSPTAPSSPPVTCWSQAARAG